MIVLFERRPSSCAVSCTSSHCAVVILSGQMTARTSSSSTSAAVPGQRREALVAQPREVVAQRDAERRRALPDLERAERVHVQVGHRVLDRAHDRDVVVAVEGRMDPALEADLGRAALPRLLGAAHDLLVRDEVRRAAQVRRELALRERAEAAAEVADVRVLDVPRHDVGDDVAVHLAPQPRRRRRRRAAAPSRARGRGARSRPRRARRRRRRGSGSRADDERARAPGLARRPAVLAREPERVRRAQHARQHAPGRATPARVKRG